MSLYQNREMTHGDKLYEPLVAAMRRTSCLQVARPSADAFASLQQFFRHGDCEPEQVYVGSCESFAHRYVLPNVIKNLDLIADLNRLGLLRPGQRIVDLGAGPGSFAIAYWLWSVTFPEPARRQATIVMVDAVKGFLDLFHELWHQLTGGQDSVVRVELSHQRIVGGIRNLAGNADVVILSNSLAEIIRNPGVDKQAFLSDIISLRPILGVIDYEYPTTKDHLESVGHVLREHFDCLSCGQGKPWDPHYRAVRLGCVRDLCPGAPEPGAQVEFLKSVWFPRAARSCQHVPVTEHILARYKQAWEEHDISLLRNLFTEDALYAEKPERRPFVGIDSICDYWETNARQQQHVEFRAKNSAYKAGSVTADWCCSFFRRDLCKWVWLDGSFTAKLRGARICEFSEQFSKRLYDSQDGIRTEWKKQGVHYVLPTSSAVLTSTGPGHNAGATDW